MRLHRRGGEEEEEEGEEEEEEEGRRGERVQAARCRRRGAAGPRARSELRLGGEWQLRGRRPPLLLLQIRIFLTDFNYYLTFFQIFFFFFPVGCPRCRPPRARSLRAARARPGSAVAGGSEAPSLSGLFSPLSFPLRPPFSQPVAISGAGFYYYYYFARREAPGWGLPLSDPPLPIYCPLFPSRGCCPRLQGGCGGPGMPRSAQVRPPRLNPPRGCFFGEGGGNPCSSVIPAEKRPKIACGGGGGGGTRDTRGSGSGGSGLG